MSTLTEQYRKATMSPEQLAKSEAAALARGEGFEECCKHPFIRCIPGAGATDSTEPRFKCKNCGTFHNTPTDVA